MKKFEIFWELPKYDTEVGSEQMLLEKWHQQTQGRVATNLQFVKKEISAKHNKGSTTKWGMPVFTD